MYFINFGVYISLDISFITHNMKIFHDPSWMFAFP